MNKVGYYRVLSTVLVGVWLVAGCAHTGGPTASPFQLARMIHIGMSRSEVRSILGEPSPLSSYDVAWYRPPPEPGAIVVGFDPQGRVACVMLNPDLTND